MQHLRLAIHTVAVAFISDCCQFCRKNSYVDFAHSISPLPSTKDAYSITDFFSVEKEKLRDARSFLLCNVVHGKNEGSLVQWL